MRWRHCKFLAFYAGFCRCLHYGNLIINFILAMSFAAACASSLEVQLCLRPPLLTGMLYPDGEPPVMIIATATYIEFRQFHDVD